MATISIFNQYGALNSKPVFEAFVYGAKRLGHTVKFHDFSADYFVIWSVLWHGRMSANYEIWHQAKKLGKKVIVLEVGCLIRGTTWRIGLNHINNLGTFYNNTNIDYHRSKKLGLQLKPWTMGGSNILICGQHTKSEQWRDKPSADIWLKNTVAEVKKFTNRPIIFRPHPRDYAWATNFKLEDVIVKIPKKLNNTYDDFDFDNDLNNAWAVINPSSNTGILSVINGVPAYVENDSLAAPVANLDFSNINIEPSRPKREEWFEKLCHTEWTIDEINQGLPIIQLNI
jgi:hypothetical protein